MTVTATEFGKRFPSLVERVFGESVAESSDSGWRARAADLERLLRRWRSYLHLRPYSAIALTGIGDGSHLTYLLDDLPEGCFVFCAEPEPAALRQALEGKMGPRLLRDQRVFFGCGELDEAFFESLSAFPILDIQDASVAIFAPLYNERADYYNRFFAEFAGKLDYWRMLYGTNATASGVWQDNTLANIRILVEAPDVGVLRDSFAGEEMVLVGAGPSLDESLSFLRSAQDRAVIVAVNSSFRALRNAGVDPHFVLAADPYEWVDKGFEGVDLGRAILVCPFIVYPKVPERFRGRIVTWSENNLLATYFRRKLGLPVGSRIVEQGTVSACAFDLAKMFGCGGLSFVGQDLAVSSDGRSHATDSFYTDYQQNQVDLAKCRRVPGNVLETVPVEEKLYIYLKTFEQLAREYQGCLRLRNLSRLGARVEGISYQPLESAVAELAGGTKRLLEDRWRVAREHCRPTARGEALRHEVAEFKAFALTVTRLALRGAIALETLERGSSSEREAMTRATNARAELIDFLESEPDRHAVLKDGHLKFELLHHVREVRALPATMEPSERQANELKSYLWALAEGAYRFTSALQRASQEQVGK